MSPPTAPKDKPKFYLTTPIYYANSRPHVGSAYTTIVCDVIARYKRMCGYDVAYLTGTDEHGVNIERAAEAHGITPQQLVDANEADFPRSVEAARHHAHGFHPHHFAGARARGAEAGAADAGARSRSAGRRKGSIYKAKYEGRYCIYDNLYVSDTPEPANCPMCGRPAELISEENYFFRLSAYQDRLLELYKNHPQFVQPDFRLNEVKSFVESGLKDVSISRKTIKWGIPWPGDPEHVFYVWYDALTSYMSGIGYAKRERKDEQKFQEILAGRPAHDRQGNHSLSRRLLAGVPDGGGVAAAEANFRARLAALRAGEDEQVEGQRRVSRADRARCWATMRCATTCCAKPSSARTAIFRAKR